jgi:hypothetical protein
LNGDKIQTMTLIGVAGQSERDHRANIRGDYLLSIFFMENDSGGITKLCRVHFSAQCSNELSDH